MNVLSLFDGMSCGQQALERAEIKVDNYFASEIDKYAIQVTMANYPETIQLGSVIDIDTSKLPQIDLLIGGSPCQSFSFAGKRKGMSTKDNIEILTLAHYLKLKAEGYEFEGQSYLFWEYIRIMQEVKPKYFFLENVMMGDKWERVISKTLGVNPIEINSASVSAQNRRRLYWTNIGMVAAGLFGDPISIIKKPEDKKLLLKDILQDNPNAKYYVSEKLIAKINRTNNGDKCFTTGDKSLCLAAGYYKQGRDNQYITEQVDEKYYLTDSQKEKVLAKTGVNPNVDEPKILDVYNKVIKQDGKSITLTDPCHNTLRLIEPNREVKQINDSNLKSNGGTQPYQQDRIYDTEGISPALAANKSDLLIKEPIPVDEKYYLSERMIDGFIKHNENHIKKGTGFIFTPTEGNKKGNTLRANGAICATDNSIIVESKIIVHNIPEIVKVRKNEVNIGKLQECLKIHKKISNKKISELLNVPKTNVDHWFRTDNYFSIPDAEIWLNLKEVLGINNDEFDKSIMEFEEKEGVFEKSNRVYDENGLAPTLTATSCDEKIIVAMRGRQNENGEYEQQLEAREDGKTNTLTSVSKDNLLQEKIMGGDYRYDEGFRWRENEKSPSLMARAREDISGPPLLNTSRIRRLTPIECERLQTVPDNYTNHVSDTQRYKMLGNGWTVDVIAHIFKYLKDAK